MQQDYSFVCVALEDDSILGGVRQAARATFSVHHVEERTSLIHASKSK